MVGEDECLGQQTMAGVDACLQIDRPAPAVHVIEKSTQLIGKVALMRGVQRMWRDKPIAVRDRFDGEPGEC